MSTCLTSSISKTEHGFCDAWFKQHSTLEGDCEIRKDFKTEIGIVCRTSVGTWEVLYASDGIILTVDGDVIMVKRK